ncbi:hypothetical protein HPB50_003620 [Hyalomma asiaticum]|uniref:Uncharacterized protein n=1 Tax=Hyalomma asiaticum TaxID=266040 RepID=A0ACB7RHK9_HYAAI|nr:hypothetical protein HPB50_003620 [Hyalomma asiaticum]
MTAKDHMRQKLDELMGTGWDGVKNSLHYSDPKVCRCFLLGLCPHDALAGTKMSMGACSKIHNYALKADFENSSRLYRQGQHRFYELTVLTYLQKVIRSCEILDRAKKGRLTRCQTTARNNRHGDKEATLKSYNDLVDKKLVEAEDLGNQGKVDDAIKVIKEVERLKRRRNRLERLLDRKSNEPVKEQKQNICEECQLCIGLDDNEQRIANHASGRLHNAILDMRRKIAELAASLEKSQMPGDWSRLDVAQQQTKQSTSRLDLASTRAHSYSPRSPRSSSRSSRRSRSRSRSSRRSRSRSSRKSYSSNYSRSSGECSSSSRSRSRSRSRSKHRRRSRKSRSKSRSRSSRRGSSRSCSRSRYSSSSSRSYSSSCSRSRNRSRSCSCCSWCSDRSRGQAKHRSRSRSRSRSQSKHRHGRRRRSRDRERRSRTPRKSKASKRSPDKGEGKTVSERSQVPDKEPKESSAKDDSKWSRKKEAESEEMKTKKEHCSPSLEAKAREAKTEKDQPPKPTGDKEGCTRELSEGEISCETESEQANSAHESPSKNLEEPEVVTKKKRRKGTKTRKKHESPRGRYSQTEDSGDESCSESSTYYQLVKRPKKKSAKIRKHSLKKKIKVDTGRMSRKPRYVHYNILTTHTNPAAQTQGPRAQVETSPPDAFGFGGRRRQRIVYVVRIPAGQANQNQEEQEEDAPKPSCEEREFEEEQHYLFKSEARFEEEKRRSRQERIENVAQCQGFGENKVEKKAFERQRLVIFLIERLSGTQEQTQGEVGEEKQEGEAKEVNEKEARPASPKRPSPPRPPKPAWLSAARARSFFVLNATLLATSNSSSPDSVYGTPNAYQDPTVPLTGKSFMIQLTGAVLDMDIETTRCTQYTFPSILDSSYDLAMSPVPKTKT